MKIFSLFFTIIFFDTNIEAASRDVAVGEVALSPSRGAGAGASIVHALEGADMDDEDDAELAATLAEEIEVGLRSESPRYMGGLDIEFPFELEDFSQKLNPEDKLKKTVAVAAEGKVFAARTVVNAAPLIVSALSAFIAPPKRLGAAVTGAEGKASVAAGMPARALTSEIPGSVARATPARALAVGASELPIMISSSIRVEGAAGREVPHPSQDLENVASAAQRAPGVKAASALPKPSTPVVLHTLRPRVPLGNITNILPAAQTGAVIE